MSESSPLDNPGTIEFWESRYENGGDRWDLGRAAPAFEALMREAEAPQHGRMIVPGCGRGHDAIFFARHGFQVTGVDFASSAIEDARRLATEAGVSARFVEHDIFTLPSSYNGAFQYVLEHTCLAAISPKRREEYATLVKRLLEPGGTLIAIFAAHEGWGGPPYSITEDGVRQLFEPQFAIERLERTAHSVPQLAGQELFSIMHPR